MGLCTGPTHMLEISLDGNNGGGGGLEITTILFSFVISFVTMVSDLTNFEFFVLKT